MTPQAASSDLQMGDMLLHGSLCVTEARPADRGHISANNFLSYCNQLRNRSNRISLVGNVIINQTNHTFK